MLISTNILKLFTKVSTQRNTQFSLPHCEEEESEA